MTQEDKELLLKDLCARLPYGVKVQAFRRHSEEDPTIIGYPYTLDFIMMSIMFKDNIEEYKPYLFPMSYIDDNEKLFAEYITTLTYDSNTHSAVPTIKTFDFYNRYHIDYRGLIEKGLALDATNKNIY